MEAQFDENQKLRQNLAEQMPDVNEMRSKPTGRDKDGLVYWFFMDSEYSVRLFTQNSSDKDGSSWKLATKDYKELKELVEKLAAEPLLEKLRSCNIIYLVYFCSIICEF